MLRALVMQFPVAHMATELQGYGSTEPVCNGVVTHRPDATEH